MKRCLTCRRTLDTGRPWDLDCGGDCAVCAGEWEAAAYLLWYAGRKVMVLLEHPGNIPKDWTVEVLYREVTS